jgi:hypothetical protein
MLRPRGDFGKLCFSKIAVDEIVDHMSGTARAYVRHRTRHEAASLGDSYGEAMPNNASTEYFPAPVMNNNKKPPMMLRSL